MPKKVLIVEDDGNIAELLHLYLEKEGFVKSQVGIGTFVSTGNTEFLRESRRRLVEQKLADAIRAAKSLGISWQELQDMMKILFEEE